MGIISQDQLHEIYGVTVAYHDAINRVGELAKPATVARSRNEKHVLTQLATGSALPNKKFKALGKRDMARVAEMFSPIGDYRPIVEEILGAHPLTTSEKAESEIETFALDIRNEHERRLILLTLNQNPENVSEWDNIGTTVIHTLIEACPNAVEFMDKVSNTLQGIEEAREYVKAKRQLAQRIYGLDQMNFFDAFASIRNRIERRLQASGNALLA